MLSCWARLGRTKCDIRVKFRLNISRHRHHVMSRQQCGTKIGPRSLPGIDQITFRYNHFYWFFVKFRNSCYWCAGLVVDDESELAAHITALHCFIVITCFQPRIPGAGIHGSQRFLWSKNYNPFFHPPYLHKNLCCWLTDPESKGWETWSKNVILRGSVSVCGSAGPFTI